MSIRSAARAAGRRVPVHWRQRLLESAPGRLLYRSVWARPGHFYSPYPDVHALGPGAPGARHDPEIAGVELRTSEGLARLARMVAEQGVPEVPEHAAPGHRYCLANEPFSYADGLVAALMLRDLAPARYVEIGSGWSTMLALDVADRYLPPESTLTVIDPYPDARLAREARLRVLPVAVQDVALAEFEALAAGDVLFIDSSHVAKAGSDVNRLYFDVLPRLAPGVYVHVHDVQWPFEYPLAWSRQGRAWNESYLLRAFLMFNQAYEIVLWGSHLVAADRAWFEHNLPLALVNPGGSIWLRRHA